jgi:ABC-type amino acid transport substrate-binding protein
LRRRAGKSAAVLRCLRRAILAVCLLPAAANLASGQQVEGRLKTIRDTGTLRIAYRTDSPPFSFVRTGEHHPSGYTIELCQRIAKSLEGELGVTLAIQWVPVDSRTRFAAITDGKADMECGSTTVTLSRLKTVDFSSMVFAETTGVLVRSNVGINRFEDMAGKTIGVVPGSSNAAAVRSQLAARKLDVKVVEFHDREEGVAALGQNAVDGFATDKSVLLSLAQGNAGQFSLLQEDLSFEPFAIMLPRGDADFRLAVNSGLARLFRSGDVIAIYGRYFSGVAPHSVWLGAVFMFGGLPE